MTHRDSLCAGPQMCAERYEHRHCVNVACDTILMAEADGPVYAFDSPQIAGYIDSNCKDAVLCARCGDNFYLLCPACAAVDPLCPHCRDDVTRGCDTSCVECAQGAA